jgi:hypothetical protein
LSNPQLENIDNTTNDSSVEIATLDTQIRALAAQAFPTIPFDTEGPPEIKLERVLTHTNKHKITKHACIARLAHKFNTNLVSEKSGWYVASAGEVAAREQLVEVLQELIRRAGETQEEKERECQEYTQEVERQKRYADAGTAERKWLFRPRPS